MLTESWDFSLPDSTSHGISACRIQRAIRQTYTSAIQSKVMQFLDLNLLFRKIGLKPCIQNFWFCWCFPLKPDFEAKLLLCLNHPGEDISMFFGVPSRQGVRYDIVMCREARRLPKTVKLDLFCSHMPSHFKAEIVQ